MQLHDQVVLVSGGARGVGRAVVRSFAAAGARVIVNYRTSADAAAALVDEIGADRAMAVRADVTDFAQVSEMVDQATQRFGAVSTVVSNALPAFSFNGDARPKLDEIDWPAFEAQLRGAVAGTTNLARATVAGMREAGFGRIITIGSNLVQNPVVPYHDYTAAKGALLALTRTLAAELGPGGITVNMVSGGLLRTTDASASTPDAVFEQIAAVTPLREVTTVEQFADAVTIFATPASRAVTGQNLVVDGGLVMN